MVVESETTLTCPMVLKHVAVDEITCSILPLLQFPFKIFSCIGDFERMHFVNSWISAFKSYSMV